VGKGRGGKKTFCEGEKNFPFPEREKREKKTRKKFNDCRYTYERRGKENGKKLDVRQGKEGKRSSFQPYLLWERKWLWERKHHVKGKRGKGGKKRGEANCEKNGFNHQS